MEDEDKGEPVPVTIKDPHTNARANFQRALRLIDKQAKVGYLGLVDRVELKQRLVAVRGYFDSNPGSAA